MKNKKKKISAFLFTLLAVSGGVVAAPLIDSSTGLSAGDLKSLPVDSLQALSYENIATFDELNKPIEINTQYSDLIFIREGVDEDSLKNALRKGDYEEWKNNFAKIGGFSDSGFISEEEFEVLRQIKNN